MLAIRLQRIGKKHQPSYRLVVVERRSKLISPPIEDLGFYDPFTKKAEFKNDRVLYWIKTGAKPSITAHNLLITKGIIDGKKIPVSIKIKKTETGDSTSPIVSDAPVQSPDLATETLSETKTEPQQIAPEAPANEAPIVSQTETA
jgi:small subunit ribosomal protein S16